MSEKVMQITSGLRSVLSLPMVYSLYQKLVFPRDKLIRDYIKPYAGQRVLDIGCGAGNIVEYLPQVQYLGVDSSEEYIRKAQRRYPDKEFRHVGVRDVALGAEHEFDIALAIGVLHHISDEDGVNLFKLAKSALKPGGKLIAVEPCYVDEQSFLAKWIISKDRGQNVKDLVGYQSLTKSTFDDAHFHIRHDLLRIPYTLVIIECIKSY